MGKFRVNLSCPVMSGACLLRTLLAIESESRCVYPRVQSVHRRRSHRSGGVKMKYEWLPQ